MKKIFLLPIIAILFFDSTLAQSVGINNDGSSPNPSAMLDVKHPNKGLLVPRVALTGTSDVATITSPATSLLVFNTATNGAGATAVSPGYYYWSGSAWLRLNTGAVSGTPWLLTGNAGTVDGTNFIGTTDNIPFNIRVNNEKSGRIDHILQNTFWGYQAGNSNTTGNQNTAVGAKTLYSNTEGYFNTANGYQSLYSNTTGNYNTASGVSTLLLNTTGSFNNAYGYYALGTNTTGTTNTAIGTLTLGSNTTGSYNTANGVSALRSNTTGNNNTANGISALYTNTTGENNTSIGAATLVNNTTGWSNTAIGIRALFNNTTGYSNVAIGAGALYSNTTISNVVAIGDSALFYNTTGIQNTAVGSKALSANQTGDYNTAFGYNALRSNTEGHVNTAFGVSALQNNTSGGNNTAFGSAALSANQGAYGNTAVGNGALAGNAFGYYNTALGFAAGTGSDALSNTIAIGSNAVVNASNTAQIGDAFITDVYFGNPATTILHANSVTPSDARFKYNIQDNVPGLDFIKQLKPVTYYFDEEKLTEFTKTGFINNSFIVSASYKGEKKLHTGFLAQDVEKIARQLGYNFDGVHAPANDKDYYSLAYSQFIMPLVKSVQQQQQIIEDQNKKIDKQAEQIEKMNERIEALAKLVDVLTHK